MPEAVVVVVPVYPCYVLLVFSGVCVTVPTVTMFAVSPACSFCITSKVIVLLSNDYVILYNLIRYSSSACQGLWGLGVGLFVFVWFTVALSNSLLKFILLSMCFSQLGLQLVVVPGWFHNLLF